MKITSIIPGQQDIATLSKNSASTTGVSFQDILAQKLEAAKSTEPSTISSVSSTVPVPAALRLDGLTLTEDTINTLENFSAALSNPSFSAQDLEPFATALEDESAALVSLKDQLPQSNPLAGLLERVATVSYVEAAKLRRGDYHA